MTRLVPRVTSLRTSQVRAERDTGSVSRDTNRLVAFSDAVFAITVTVLVLEIKPPTDGRDVLHALCTLALLISPTSSRSCSSGTCG